MEDVKNLAIKTEYLPKNWPVEVGEKFGLKPNTIRKIAKGTRKKPEVFDHLLELAKVGLAAKSEREEKLSQMVDVLQIAS